MKGLVGDIYNFLTTIGTTSVYRRESELGFNSIHLEAFLKFPS